MKLIKIANDFSKYFEKLPIFSHYHGFTRTPCVSPSQLPLTAIGFVGKCPSVQTIKNYFGGRGGGGDHFPFKYISFYIQAQKQKLKFWQRFRIFISCLHEIGTSLGLFRQVENKRECSDCPYLRKI